MVAAPGTPFAGLTVNALPLHIAGVYAPIAGLGLTVTVTVNVDPTQAPAAPEVGVTVYVAVCCIFVGLGSCVGSTFTVTVDVNPKPVIPNQTSTICSGATFTVSPANGGAVIVPAGTTYTWAAPVVTGGITGGSAQAGQASISQTLTNPTNIARTATYTVTPTSGAVGSCVGSTFTVTVTVNPKPVMAAYTSTICSGSTFTISPANGSPTAATIVPAGTTYSWPAPVVTGGITGGSGQAGQASVSQTLTNPINTIETATYTVTPTGPVGLGSCVGATFTVTVTVNPTPAVDIITNKSFCAGSTTTVITFTSAFNVAGTVFNWTNSNTAIGLAASGSGNIGTFSAANTTNALKTAFIVCFLRRTETRLPMLAMGIDPCQSRVRRLS